MVSKSLPIAQFANSARLTLFNAARILNPDVASRAIRRHAVTI
jgi:hypothetical protein